jgi:hypothetical protein
VTDVESQNKPLKPNSLRSFSAVEAALNWSALAVLIVGLTTSLAIWHTQDKRDAAAARAASQDDILPTLDSRKYERDVEYYSGKAGVLMEEAKGWFHGKPLAKGVAVVSIVTAAGLFLVAARRPD